MGNGNLSYVVLALVAMNEEGIHGYRLRTEFNALFGDACPITFGRLYRILDGLEMAYYLTLEERIQSGRPTRKNYRVTDRGLAKLREWLTAPFAASPYPLADELSPKLLLVTPGDTDTIATLVREHRRVCLDHLARVAKKERVLKRVMVDDHISRMILDGAETRVRARLQWLERVERIAIKSWLP